MVRKGTVVVERQGYACILLVDLSVSRLGRHLIVVVRRVVDRLVMMSCCGDSLRYTRWASSGLRYSFNTSGATYTGGVVFLRLGGDDSGPHGRLEQSEDEAHLVLDDSKFCQEVVGGVVS